MTGFDLPDQSVDNLLLRLYLHSLVHIVGGVCFHSPLNDIIDSPLQHSQLVLRLLGEHDILIIHFLGGFGNIQGVVADSLHVADGVQQCVQNSVVVNRQFLVGQLHQVRTQGVFVPIGLVFQINNLLHHGIIKLYSQTVCQLHSFLSSLGHLTGDLPSPAHSHSRGSDQTAIQ